MSGCTLCPRACGVDRDAGEIGLCGQGSQIRVARAELHFFEEPPISGTRGSGTVFFVGCPLGCVFCQNRAISRGGAQGRVCTPKELASIFLSLQDKGAHNINLVTATHFLDGVVEALSLCRDRLTVPVVYNTSGYERVESLRRLEGLVDVYLPDFKYLSPELSERLSGAPDYAEVATEALLEMHRQTGAPLWEEKDGIRLLRRGVVVRHLVLPGYRRDSMDVLTHLASLLPGEEFLISLMSQYTPEFAADCPDTHLHRRVTRFEYESVVDHAVALGLDGFLQDKASATAHYTPDFDRFSDGE